MPTLQEILAAKKAALAQSAPNEAVKEEPKKAEKKEEVSPLADFEKAVPSVPAPKKSFAEILAEKKAAQNQTQAKPLPPDASPTILPSSKESSKESTSSQEPVPQAALSKAVEKAVSQAEETEKSEATPAEKSYYEDIKPKINLLSSMADSELKNAMKTLKEALMQNPSATELMLDSDIGEMVKALRRMTGEAITEATTKEKKPKKQKEIDLSNPDVMAAVLDEL